MNEPKYNIGDTVTITDYDKPVRITSVYIDEIENYYTACEVGCLDCAGEWSLTDDTIVGLYDKHADQANTIQSILDWFRLSKSNPTDKDIATQLGCHYEEIAEMADALQDFSLSGELAMQSELYKQNSCINEIDKKELLDSLCDQIVTALGVGYMLGFDMAGALSEVNRSNWSKFEKGKPILNEQGKIMKGKGYYEPNLEPFL